MSDGMNLINREMPFSFAGQEYEIKRATLQQVIEFQRRAKEIGDENDAGGDLRIAAYAIFLILNGQDKNITEDFVVNNCPGDLDVMDALAKLGFMSQQKVEAMDRVRNALVLTPIKPEV